MVFNFTEKYQFSTQNYGKQCLKVEQTKHIFLLKMKDHQMKTRKGGVYEKVKTLTKRFQNSTVPFIQKLLNAENEKKRTPG